MITCQHRDRSRAALDMRRAALNPQRLVHTEPKVGTDAGEPGVAVLPARARASEAGASKPAIALCCAGLLAATIAPIRQNWSDAPVDGFPFSYYPMFSERVGETFRVTHVVGIDGKGREHVIPYRYLGDGGLNQVLMSVERSAHRNPEKLCERVARRLSRGPPKHLRGVRKLVVRTGRYVMEAFYAGRLELRAEREHARCRVAR